MCNVFNKVFILYEGRQIFFGHTNTTKNYFIKIGFKCPARQTTPDLLTSITSPSGQIIRLGFKNRVLHTPDDFAAAWKNSTAYEELQREIKECKQEFPIDGLEAKEFRANKQAAQARTQRHQSPYTLSYRQQVMLCVWRGFKRLVSDPSLNLTALIGNFIMALIVDSVFFNMQPTTNSCFQRGALLFLACLSNAFSSALEVRLLLTTL